MRSGRDPTAMPRDQRGAPLLGIAAWPRLDVAMTPAVEAAEPADGRRDRRGR
jgi:hypothetical protein